MEKRTRVRFTSDFTLIRCRLAELDLRRHFRVHQRSTSICKYYLTGDPTFCKRDGKIPHQRFQSRRARQTCWRADFQHEADDPQDVFRIILTHDRSPFRVQPLHAAIIVHDAELDR